MEKTVAVRAEPPLFQRRIYRGEFGIELGADALNRGNDRECDPAGDQTILDGGRSRLIRQESRKHLPHSKLLSTRHGIPQMVERNLGLIGCQRVEEHAERSVKADIDLCWICRCPLRRRRCPPIAGFHRRADAKRDSRASGRRAAPALPIDGFLFQLSY